MAMEQQPPPAAKFEDENSYNLATSGRCRQAIHTYKNYLLATVLLAWSFGEPRLFKAWLVSTTKHFLSLPMWKTRYFSQKEHGTQWATRLLSAAFGALTVVTGVTVCFLNGHYVAGAASATACASWYVHGARMRQLGFIDKADAKTWTETGVVLRKLDFLWKVVNTNETTCKQPFTNATLIILAYNIVLGTASLYYVLGNTGAVIVWANCLWGFLSLWLLIHGGLLAGAFDAICEVSFNDDFDRLMKAAVAEYEKVAALDGQIATLELLDDAAKSGAEVHPVCLEAARDDANALLRSCNLPELPTYHTTAAAFKGRLGYVRHNVVGSYETARRAVVSYLTGDEDGRIVFSAAPTGRLADIAACYHGKLADDAKDKELGGIAHQCAAHKKFRECLLGKRVGGGRGGYTRQGGLKDRETIVMVVQANACTEDGFKKGQSTNSTKQNPLGLVKIEIGRDAVCTSAKFVKGRPAMRSQLAGVYAYTRAQMWWEFGEESMDADALGALDINTVSVQGYLPEFFRERRRWEVNASRNSQGLAMGLGTRVRHGVDGAFVRRRRDIAPVRWRGGRRARRPSNDASLVAVRAVLVQVPGRQDVDAREPRRRREVLADVCDAYGRRFRCGRALQAAHDQRRARRPLVRTDLAAAARAGRQVRRRHVGTVARRVARDARREGGSGRRGLEPGQDWASAGVLGPAGRRIW